MAVIIRLTADPSRVSLELRTRIKVAVEADRVYQLVSVGDALLEILLRCGLFVLFCGLPRHAKDDLSFVFWFECVRRDVVPPTAPLVPLCRHWSESLPKVVGSKPGLELGTKDLETRLDLGEQFARTRRQREVVDEDDGGFGR